MTDAPILSQFDPATGIARITFNRPARLNAIDVALAEALQQAARALAQQQGLRCVVLTGAGRAFMAGGDVSGFSGQPAQTAAALNAILDGMNAAILTLRGLEAPLIAGVRGAAAGAGFSLALAADLVLAEEGAQFLIAYDRIGAVPDCGASWFLPRKVGTGRAAQMMLLSRALTAAEALDWGIVAEVAPADGFDAALDALATKLAAGPTRSYAAFRRLCDGGAVTPLAAHLEAERAEFLAIARSADFAEGVAGFLGKRRPVFTGR